MAPDLRDSDFLEQLRRELGEHATAKSTRRNYAGHQKAWRAWCASSEVDPEAATPEDVARHLTWYLLELDGTGSAVRDTNGVPVAAIATSTLQLRLSAIDKEFETAGRNRPGHDRSVRTLMEGVRRLYGIAPVHAKAPVLLADLRLMVAVLSAEELRRSRDLVMIQARRQTRATPGQLARLDWDDVDLTGVDAYLLLPPDKRGGRARRVRLRASSVEGRCPVRALRQLRTTHEGLGPVLTGPGGERLTRQAIDKRLRVLARHHDDVSALAPRIAMKAVRDTAIVTCGWFAALRRSNLVALRWSDLTWDPNGDIRVHLRRSKTDQQGKGEWNWLPRLDGDVACPVAALSAWRDRVAHLVGGDPMVVCPEAPVFPAMNRHDQIKNVGGGMRRLRGEAVNELIQELAERTGLTTRSADADSDATSRSRWGAHSLRSGFVTQACMARMSLIEIAKVTHHADPRSLAGYHRPVDGVVANTLRAMVAATSTAELAIHRSAGYSGQRVRV